MKVKEDTLITDFTEGNIRKQLISFTIPLFLSSLLQVTYSMADMIIIGKANGAIGLSAVSIGGDVSHFLTFIAMGLTGAGQIIVSQYIGKGDREKVGRFIGTMFGFLFCTSLIVGGICIFFRHQLLHLMNTPKEAYQDALDYSTISICGLVFIYGYNNASAVLRGMGDSKHPFIFIAISTGLNIVLDLLFVLVFNMGAMGVALATVLSQGFSFLCSIVFLYQRRATMGIAFKMKYFVQWNASMLLILLKLGLPMALKMASIQLSRLFVNAWINSYGIYISAFAGVANKIGFTSHILSNSLNTAGATMVGQNIGAGKFERVIQTIVEVFKIITLFAITISVLFLLFPRQIYGCFTNEEEVIKIGIEYLPIAILIFFGSAARAGMNALINGSGNYSVNFATALFDGIIFRIGFSLIFGLWLKMGAMGLWLGDALAGFTPFVIGIFFYFSGSWKKSLKL